MRYAIPVAGRYRRQRDEAFEELARLRSAMATARHISGGTLLESGGLKLLLDPKSLVDRTLIENGAWESEHLSAMTRAASSIASDKRRKVFLDIGAHWGLYALSMWKLGVFDEIHCFEPDPLNHAQLCAQLFLNDAAYDIRVHRAAVFDRPGAVRMVPARDIPDNRGHAALADDGEGIVVDAVVIDTLFPLQDAIVFVKLDIEGSEAAALRGMSALLMHNEVYLQCESFDGLAPAISAAIPARVPQRAVIDPDYIFSSFPLPSA